MTISASQTKLPNLIFSKPPNVLYGLHLKTPNIHLTAYRISMVINELKTQILVGVSNRQSFSFTKLAGLSF